MARATQSSTWVSPSSISLHCVSVLPSSHPGPSDVCTHHPPYCHSLSYSAFPLRRLVNSHSDSGKDYLTTTKTPNFPFYKLLWKNVPSPLLYILQMQWVWKCSYWLSPHKITSDCDKESACHNQMFKNYLLNECINESALFFFFLYKDQTPYYEMA